MIDGHLPTEGPETYHRLLRRDVRDRKGLKIVYHYIFERTVPHPKIQA